MTDENSFDYYIKDSSPLYMDCSYFYKEPLVFMDSLQAVNVDCVKLFDDVQSASIMEKFLTLSGCLDSGLL